MLRIDCETDEKLREECGVFGVYHSSGEPAAPDIYYGLCYLQHRGQEACGMAVCDTSGPAGNMSRRKDKGLVGDVFDSGTLGTLQGNLGIGHVRYSTTGGSTPENAQPLVLNYLKGTLALAHNGNLVNAGELRKELQKEGAVFHTSTDSEVIACRIARERAKSGSVEEAILRTARCLRGGYALVVMSPRKLIGVRDPLGLKPLCLGKRGGSYFLASESCALIGVGAQPVRDILPGEIVTITDGQVLSDVSLVQEKRAHCIFEYIYFARPDSILDGVSVYDARVRAGEALAASCPADADLVTGVPDSGVAAALGFAQAAGLPFTPVFHKNSYVGRTFIKPTQEQRAAAVRLKLNVLCQAVKGKRIVLIDDSIVRGNTIASLISLLREAGASEVHVRISSPPFLHPCFYGIDVPDDGELIAVSHTEDEICAEIGADSLGYLGLEHLKQITEGLPLCKACFDGAYPV